MYFNLIFEIIQVGSRKNFKCNRKAPLPNKLASPSSMKISATAVADIIRKMANRSAEDNRNLPGISFAEDDAPVYDVNAAYEHGFIDAGLIRKYAPDGEYSVFMCGPKAMYTFGEAECKKLGLPKRRYRMEMSGDYMNAGQNPNYPKDQIGSVYSLTVDIRGEKTVVPCKADESLLWAMERAGIKAPSHCRSGECSWCHSKLLSGQVYIPSDADGRRLADKKFGWIHPCVSYPLSNVTLCVYPTE